MKDNNTGSNLRLYSLSARRSRNFFGRVSRLDGFPVETIGRFGRMPSLAATAGNLGVGRNCPACPAGSVDSGRRPPGNVS